MLRSLLPTRSRGCDIIDGTIRDMTYIAANMRERDVAECMCQVPEGTDQSAIGIIAHAASPEHKYVVLIEGEPEVAFGCSPNTYAGNVQSLWMFGTDRSRLAIPAITNFFHDVIIPSLVETGKTRVEVRALSTNETTIRWLTKVGLRMGTVLNEYGRNGENFVLLYTTRELWLRHTRPWDFRRPR